MLKILVQADSAPFDLVSHFPQNYRRYHDKGLTGLGPGKDAFCSGAQGGFWPEGVVDEGMSVGNVHQLPRSLERRCMRSSQARA